MAESTSSLSRTELRTEIARFLGISTTASDWTTAESSLVDSVLRSGLNQFYAPPPCQSAPHGHDWSFLKVAGSISTTAGDWTYDLPDDFGEFYGPVTFGTVGQRPALQRVSEADILTARQHTQDNARPVMCAVRHKTAPAASAGQRWELLLHQPPDAVYTLTYRYRVLRGVLTAALPYPYGGSEHGETILESCLAVAERRVNDGSGVHAAEFARLLEASVVLDKRRSPETLGYNGNPSRDAMPDRQSYNVSFGGTVWD